LITRQCTARGDCTAGRSDAGRDLDAAAVAEAMIFHAIVFDTAISTMFRSAQIWPECFACHHMGTFGIIPARWRGTGIAAGITGIVIPRHHRMEDRRDGEFDTIGVMGNHAAWVAAGIVCGYAGVIT
tara:strand:- start:223 stop:603 length:381 start_codon:yes stop_codon:yes gene_type:complete